MTSQDFSSNPQPASEACFQLHTEAHKNHGNGIYCSQHCVLHRKLTAALLIYFYRMST